MDTLATLVVRRVLYEVRVCIDASIASGCVAKCSGRKRKEVVCSLEGVEVSISSLDSLVGRVHRYSRYSPITGPERVKRKDLL